MDKNKIKKIILMLFWVSVAAFIQAISLSSFSVPGNIYNAGITGLSRITSDVLRDFFNINIQYTIFYFVINAILAFIVYKYIGKLFTIFSFIETALMSLFASYLKPIIQIDDILLLAIFGGIINGFGVGITLSHNASTGGTDFISIYLSNKLKKSTWNILFGFNCVLIIATGIIYDWQRAFYSIIYQFCSTQVINRMHKRYTSQTITIITSLPEEVSNSIFATIRHGITKIDAEGAYKQTKTTMLYTVVNGYQTDSVIEAILKVDPKAFINIQDTKTVIGNYYQVPLD